MEHGLVFLLVFLINMEHKVDPCSMHIHVPRHCSRNMELMMWQHVIAITRYLVVTELDVEYDVFHMEHMAHSLKPNVFKTFKRLWHNDRTENYSRPPDHIFYGFFDSNKFGVGMKKKLREWSGDYMRSGLSVTTTHHAEPCTSRQRVAPMTRVPKRSTPSTTSFFWS